VKDRIWLLMKFLGGFLFAYVWLLICGTAITTLEWKFGGGEFVPNIEGLLLTLGGFIGALCILYWLTVKSLLRLVREHRKEFKKDE